MKAFPAILTPVLLWLALGCETKSTGNADLGQPGSCTKDSDCSLGRSCRVGLCEPLPTTPDTNPPLPAGQCRTAADCPEPNQPLCSSKSHTCLACAGPQGALLCQEVHNDDIDTLLLGVWGSGPDDVWAVGQTNRYESLIQHWDGIKWSKVVHPGQGPLARVRGTGKDDVWVVGAAGAVLHFSGGSFSTMQHGLTTDDLDEMWVTATDVYAVGGKAGKVESGTILHLNRGTGTWDVQHPVAKELLSIWGQGAVMWAGGRGGTMLRWDGNWVPVAAGLSADQEVTGLFGFTAEEPWATARGVNSLKDQGFILQRVAGTWTPVRSLPANSMLGLWGSDSAHMWFAGARAVLRYDGRGWDTIDRQTGLYVGSILYSVWGSSAVDVWVAGEYLELDDFGTMIWSHGVLLHHPL